MCKLHIRWIEDALKSGPKSARDILDTMHHRRSCPTMNEISNYLSKNSKFKVVNDRYLQSYLTHNGIISLWGLTDE